MFDARGNAVWEWSLSTGIFGRDVGTERLKKLEAPDLKIAEDSQKAQASGTSSAQRGSGFDPYDTHSVRRATPAPVGTGKDPYNTAGAVRGAQRARGSKPTDLRRLSEWIKQQRELHKKDE